MKFLGPILFGVGVIVAISGGAKVTDTRIKDAEETIAAAKAAKEAAPAVEEPQEIKPLSELELIASAFSNITAREAEKAAKEAAKKKGPKDIKFEMPDTKWYFTIGIVFAGAGLAVWWKDVFAARSKAADESSGDDRNPLALLQTTTDTLNALTWHEPTAEALCEKVDEILATSVMPMIEVRQRLFDTLGMNVGAEVLVIAAAGERLLNRTWSAAADGDIDEALDSIRKATQAFAEAQETVNNNTLQHTKLPEFRTIT